MYRIATITLAALLVGAAAHANVFYAAPTGSATGTGSITSPWSLAKALAGGNPTGAVKPGDTIYLRAGVYGSGGSTKYTCSLKGASGAPIIVRNAPGENATVNAGIAVTGSYTWLWGLEVTNTSTVGHLRSAPCTGVSDGDAKRPVGVNFRPGSLYNKVINCIIHDAGRAGIGGWANEFEAYGNIVYNCGIFDSSAPATPTGDRRRGDAMYANVTDPGTTLRRDVEENIAFRNFNMGWKVYTEWAGQYVNNFIEIGNVASTHPVWNMTLEDSAHPITYNDFHANMTYQRRDSSAYSVKYGYRTDNQVGILTDNFLACGTFGSGPLYLKGWTSLTNAGNALVSSKLAPPAGPTVYVRPNRYEPGRGNVVVYNYGGSPSVSVDLTPLGLTKGQPVAFFDAQNPKGNPVLTGTWNGTPIALPMNQTVVAPMVGDVPVPVDMRHTAPYFGAFVVLPIASATSTILTRTYVPAQTATAGTSTILNGWLLTADKTAYIKGKTLRFMLDAAEVGTGLTDTYGRARLPYAVPASWAGTVHSLTVAFADTTDPTYATSSETNTLRVQ